MIATFVVFHSLVKAILQGLTSLNLNKDIKVVGIKKPSVENE